MSGKWEGRVKKPPVGRRKSIVYSTKRPKKTEKKTKKKKQIEQ
jgi:hypothetical protein